MLDTIDLLHLTPRLALLELVNARNGLTLRNDFIAILDPTVITGRETKVTLRVRKSFDPFAPVPFQGDVEFKYNRLDLTTFFTGTKVEINMDLPTTTSRFVEIMTQEYGYVFDDDDFYEEVITAENAHGYILKATPRSLRWIGQWKVNLLSRGDLGELAKVTDIGSLDPVKNQGRPFVSHVKPFTDGLYYGSYLRTVQKGDIVDGPYLASVLNTLYSDLVLGVGKTWGYSATPGPKNLFGAIVTYNSYTANIGAAPYNPATTRVLLIELSPVHCTDVTGPLVIYYNARIPILLPEFPITFKQPAELLNLGQTSGYNWPNEIITYPTDYEFITHNLPVTFLDSIYNQPGASAIDRFKCVNGPAKNNLFGAKVLFNGFNRKYPPAYNGALTYVWVIQLNDEYCTNLRGNLVIYYNLNKLL